MRVLLVEDESVLSRQIVHALSQEGYAADWAGDGEEGRFLGETEPYDAVILDLGLPKLDGIAVLKAWRTAGIDTPVLILTARGSWHERVEGLDAGADDYLAKPFHMEELLARVRALIRRAAGRPDPILRHGGLELDTRSGRVSVNNAPVQLTAHEFRVLSYLLHHADRVISRTELMEHIYGYDADRDSNTIEVFVGRLRRKLGGDLIQTVRGLGYRLADSP